MKKTIALLIIFIGFLSVFAQVQTVKRFIQKMYFSKDTSRSASFVLIPILGVAPETGIEIGASVPYSFYADTLDRKTDVSNIFGYVTITAKSQATISLKSTYWSILGLDVQEQSLVGGQSPFYLLPAMGGDEMMRGYYSGRFRDRNYIAGQTELSRVGKRFGIVGFAGTGEVFHGAFSAYGLKPDDGGGVRYFFDVQKGLGIRVDYGVGEKRPGESRQSGLYIGLGQAF